MIDSWLRQAASRSSLVIRRSHRLYRYLLSRHFIATLDEGVEAVYCPVSMNASFNFEDASNSWCPFCSEHFNHKES